MPSLANLLEDYRNWRGRSEWEQGKAIQDIYGGDPTGQERFERFGGFGTGSHGVGGLAGMIKASHGSPHLFDKFDFSKIGTGEGAQAYGHGGYFAQGFDSPVAKEYRDALSGVEVGGKVLKPDWDDPNYYPLQALRKHGDDIEKARQDVYERNARIPGGWPEELEAFESLVKQGIQRNQGHLYNVELKWPDVAREAADPLGEHHLLDWNEALSKQPQGVRDAFNEFVNSPEGEALAKEYWSYKPGMKLSDLPEWNDVSGEAIYKNALGTSGDWVGASERLRKHGVPGIRYLDQASRGAGTGSRNYVMFDDQFPNIVSRNGVSLSDLLRR